MLEGDWASRRAPTEEVPCCISRTRWITSVLLVIREELVGTESENRFRYADFPVLIAAARLDYFRFADSSEDNS